MSPSENSPYPEDALPSKNAPVSTSEPVPNPSAPDELQEAPKLDGSEPAKTENHKNLRKKPDKKAKIVLLVVGWLLLLGLAASVAFLLKPAPEMVYTDAIIEAYKFSDLGSAQIVDTVDNLDYYGTYTANPLTLTINEVTPYGMSYYYTISGLKNKTVEDKINNRIKSAFEQLSASYTSDSKGYVRISVVANYFNIISLRIISYDYETFQQRNEGLTFELNNGDELTFDDLFSANLNRSSLLYKSFYDSFSTKIQFAKLDANKRLATEPYYPDPTKCQAQYCPYPGETYDSIRALIAGYDEQLANIEQTVLSAIQNYLTGAKKFYLNSYGPAFILSDGTAVEMELQDNIRYAVYLKNYRSSDSIFENAASALSTPFFTEFSNQDINYIKEETDTYLFDYLESDSSEDGISSETRQALREYVKSQALSTPSETGKFRYISASVLTSTWHSIRSGYIAACVYETDKSYYDSVFRKAIVDGKNQPTIFGPGQQPPRAGRYDKNRVAELAIDGANYCYDQFQVFVTDSGAVLTEIGDILVNPSGSERGWKEYVDYIAYVGACNLSREKCFTEEERQANELVYDFAGGAIRIQIKDDSESGATYLYTVDIKDIPKQYINPAILIK